MLFIVPVIKSSPFGDITLVVVVVYYLAIRPLPFTSLHGGYPFVSEVSLKAKSSIVQL